ncbi:ATPase family protein associated with various cellular activities (AAA) [Halospina denitrificans]|uniref:ATPase family protein associated with various cellular activities (AAA) n=1 Tax=Halospina denitrificans TaxID=332522 RepID=A0A4R7K3I6_9GAMM|nr:MoxR family ATPase [Halospina denitrificans]TDT44563.1 ATPase family protein associated with various cellular activities (AAA) [Halospina denitrificans]
MTTTAAPEQIKQILTHQVALLDGQPELAHELPPVMLWGPPGVGKSTLVRDVCHEQGIQFIDIRLSQREPVDLRGLPVPKDDHVDWLIAGEWPRDPESRGIILFDELTAADRSMQVAAYEMILDRRLGDLYSLPDKWLVVGAGNRSEDHAVSHTISSALANRFCHLELEPELETWCQWASRQGLHPDVIAFLRFRPECFFSMEGELERGWPSPRSWTRVAQSLINGASRLPEESLSLMVQGLVGQGAGTEFLAFRRQSSDLPDIEAMLLGRAEPRFPERADQRYAFATALPQYLWQGPKEQQPQRVDGFFRISEAMTSDFATLAMLDAMDGPNASSRERRAETLLGHRRFAQWSQQHGAVFSRHVNLNTDGYPA